MTRFTALGPLPFLSGSTSKEMRCPSFERLEPGPLDRGDVHEHVAPAVVRLDEAVAALGIEELDRTGHCHRETPLPVVARRRPPRRDGSAGHSQAGKASAVPASVTPPAPTGGGTSKPPAEKLDQIQPVEKWRNYISPAEPVEAVAAALAPARIAASAGSSAASSLSSVQGGLTTIRPHAARPPGAAGGRR